MKADMSSFKTPLPKTSKEAYSRNKHETSSISLTSSLKRNIIFQSTSILGVPCEFSGIGFPSISRERSPSLGSAGEPAAGEKITLARAWRGHEQVPWLPWRKTPPAAVYT